ncbi:type II toxin-antitoxin system VapC family toxin [Herbiconiux sp. A18JL235]|uniref:Ribonuclease VapC n=1 Tax=Herbiconiux sp. A18JL235 TaxID=3152363 RepID=A0AB39BIZ9_9MICO
MIYADSNILIHLVEDVTEIGDKVRADFAERAHDVGISPLVVLECKVVPLRNDDQILVRRYERVLEKLTILEIAPQAYEDAARLRARYGLKTLDALHVATAHFHLCEAFWTHDRRLAAARGGMEMVSL